MRRFVDKSGSALLCALLALACAGNADARVTQRAKQKAAAEARRAGISKQLQVLQAEISKTESAKDDASDALAESESAISDANRALHDLAQEQQDTNAKLQALNDEQERLQKTIDTQKQQLATLLRNHYVAGNEDRIKLLLSGDNPNRINRDLQMMAYVSKAQARLLDSLRANLAQVQANRDKVQEAKDELEEIAQDQRDAKTKLEKEKSTRASLLASLSTKLSGQRRQASKLEQDEKRLSGLVDQLTRIIHEQEVAAAAERKRQQELAAARAKAAAEAKAAALARAKAERERLAQQGKPGAKPPPEPEPEPPKVAEEAPAPEKSEPVHAVLPPALPDGAFASLRGKLSVPINGKIEARFGAKRPDGGPAWKGMFIKAPEGTEVRATGPGRVVKAMWLRGYGNMIIIDHGGDYLSIYGYAQTLLKREGDMVKAGEPIATAGNTGGVEESGLFFSLLHKGKPFDPESWVHF